MTTAMRSQTSRRDSRKQVPGGAFAFLVPVVAAGSLVLMSSPSTALAQDADATASCSFFEIQASDEGEGIAPELRPLEKQLARPPLSAWKKFSLLAHHDKKLEMAKAEVLTTATKLKLEVVYEEYSKKAKKERFKLRLSFKRPNNKVIMTTSVTVDAGDYLVISGASNKGTSNFLAITCKK